MTDITAKVICDSLNARGQRLITLQLRYPRFIHAEFMTHRVFSRNASSSRAIPVAKMVEQVRTAPAMPIHWGLNQSGMQAETENDNPITLTKGEQDEMHSNGSELHTPEEAWKVAANKAADIAQAFAKAGYHKQVVNRIMEPFLHIDVVVTSTQWSNFFALRDHKDAQPEIHELARQMREAILQSDTRHVADNEWHLPYIHPVLDRAFASTHLTQHGDINASPQKTMLDDLLIRMSAARCARVSYSNHDGSTPSIEDDLKLYDRLVGSQPIHASPTEHQAKPYNPATDGLPHVQGNFQGWAQARKFIEGECQ